jgi:hypothetical protein
MPKPAGCAPALLQSVAADDLVGCIHLGYFAASLRFLQDRRSLLKSRITAAIDCLAIFMDLKKHQPSQCRPCSVLCVVEQHAKALCSDSQGGSAKILGRTGIGGGQAAVVMRLQTRVSSGESAFLFRLSSTHWATHGQDLSSRQWLQSTPRLPSFAATAICPEGKCDSAAC